MELNKIYNMDCLEGLKQLEDNSIDLIVTDPPYNIGIDKWDKIPNYLEWIEEISKECKRVLKDNGSLYIWGNMKYIAEIKCIFSKNDFILNSWIIWNKKSKQQNSTRSYADIVEHCLFFTFQDQTGAKVVEEMIKPINPFSLYLKSEFKKANITRKEISKLFPSRTGGLTGCVSNWLNGDNVITKEQYLKIRKYLDNNFLLKEYEFLRKEYEDLRKEYEDLRKEYEDLRYTFNYLDIGEKRNPKDKRSFTKDVTNPINVWEHQNTHELNKIGHTTPKPLSLIKKSIKASSKENDIVLDLFMGSGTTAVACKELERNFIGFEISEEYCKIAEERLRKVNKKQKTLLDI